MTLAEISSNAIALCALGVSFTVGVWTMGAERRAARKAEVANDQHWRRTELALEALYGRPVNLRGDS